MNFRGSNTEDGSKLTGEIEGSKFEVNISVNDEEMTFTTVMSGGDTKKAVSLKVANGSNGSGSFTIGTLKSGREKDTKSSTTIKIKHTVDSNGNAVFNVHDWVKQYNQDKQEDTRTNQ